MFQCISCFIPYTSTVTSKLNENQGGNYHDKKLTDGYNGNLTSKQNGSVGGYMVKKMIEQQERQMSGNSQNEQY